MANLYQRGSIVLVPFPFTDLSQSKQRPAIVISPSDFSGDNIIVCAVSSRTSSMLKPWEVTLDPEDTQSQRLPKTSVVKVDRLLQFTILELSKC
jgi:mRNA interferase MazF